MNEDLNFEVITQSMNGKGKGYISHTDCKKYLRHRQPVLAIDWVKDHDFEAGWVHAVRAISITDRSFHGHFDDAAMYPGTNLTQDINQIGTLLFSGMFGPFENEVTSFTSIDAKFGHPIPPGCIIDMAVWMVNKGNTRRVQVRLEGRVRDFPWYDQPNGYGLKFPPAIQVTSEIIRAKRDIYQGIWM